MALSRAAHPVPAPDQEDAHGLAASSHARSESPRGTREQRARGGAGKPALTLASHETPRPRPAMSPGAPTGVVFVIQNTRTKTGA